MPITRLIVEWCSLTADRLRASAQVLALHCDVADEHSVRGSLSSCVAELGLPHLIVNSSSGNIIAPTERLSTRAWQTVVNSSLTGTANVILDVGKRLIAAKQGDGADGCLAVSPSLSPSASLLSICHPSCHLVESPCHSSPTNPHRQITFPPAMTPSHPSYHPATFPPVLSPCHPPVRTFPSHPISLPSQHVALPLSHHLFPDIML